MKIKKINLQFICIILFFSFIFSMKIVADEDNRKISIYPENSIKKINQIKEKLKLNKKYKVADNIEYFKNLLIGKWEGPPHAFFIFKKNSKYEMISSMAGEYKERGDWKVEGNILSLKSNNKWNSYEIRHYFLDKFAKRKKVEYSLYIIFRKRLRGVSDALVISYSYKK